MSTMRQAMEILAIKKSGTSRNHAYFSNYSNFEKRNFREFFIQVVSAKVIYSSYRFSLYNIKCYVHDT